MTNHAFSIETSRYAAGLAIADGQGYRFIAAHPLFRSLEGKHFNDVPAVERAARRQEASNRTDTRRQDSRGQVFRSWSQDFDGTDEGVSPARTIP